MRASKWATSLATVCGSRRTTPTSRLWDIARSVRLALLIKATAVSAATKLGVEGGAGVAGRGSTVGWPVP